MVDLPEPDLITLGILQKVALQAKKPEVWVEPLNTAMKRFQINNPKRAAAFLAQIIHESSYFNHLEENLNYSAQRLCLVWPQRFPTIESAKPYERNPVALGNKTYGGRLGNGPEDSGDGHEFRGRGLIMLTGRENYKTVGQALNLPLEQQPSLAKQPGTASLIAGIFWQQHGLNQLADQDTTKAFRKITFKINGGIIGWQSRVHLWHAARTAFNLGEGKP